MNAVTEVPYRNAMMMTLGCLHVHHRPGFCGTGRHEISEQVGPDHDDGDLNCLPESVQAVCQSRLVRTPISAAAKAPTAPTSVGV
jgi:hypothetical protein